MTESTTVTAEVTPVQTTSSDLQRTITGDQLTAIQVKGRDIFGMLKILPGVVDTTFSRDFAQLELGPRHLDQRRQLAQQEHDD